MANILIVDSDQFHADAVSWSLRALNHHVQLCADSERATRLLREASSGFDVVILNVTEASFPWPRIITNLQTALLEMEVYPTPSILCTSRIKKAPEFELRIEQMGARYVFEG